MKEFLTIQAGLIIRRIWHLFLVSVGLVAIPGMTVGAWLGVSDMVPSIIFIVVAGLGVLMNVAAYRNTYKHQEKTPVFIMVLVGWILLASVGLPAVVAAYTWHRLTGQFAFQYDQDYPIAHYADPDGRFEFDYPAEWRVLLPSEARRQIADRVTVPDSAVIFVGNPPEWNENINIQMSPATYRKGEIIGDEEDELEDAGPALRSQLQSIFPDGSVGSYSVFEKDGRVYLQISMRQDERGVRFAQRAMMAVIGDQQVTFTMTAPVESAYGLFRFRFDTVVRSFHSPAQPE